MDAGKSSEKRAPFQSFDETTQARRHKGTKLFRSTLSDETTQLRPLRQNADLRNEIMRVPRPTDFFSFRLTRDLKYYTFCEHTRMVHHSARRGI